MGFHLPKTLACWTVLGIALMATVTAAVLRFGATTAESRAHPSQLQVRGGGEPRANDCGATALYLICRIDGRPRSMGSLRELSKTSSSGTTMLNLKRAALEVGFRVDARQGSFGVLQRHVRNAGSYAIVYTIGDRGGHFLAVAGAPDERRIRVADVARGVADLRQHAFFSTYDWRGYMLLLSADEPPERGGS